MANALCLLRGCRSSLPAASVRIFEPTLPQARLSVSIPNGWHKALLPSPVACRTRPYSTTSDPTPGRALRNHEIKAPLVQLVNPRATDRANQAGLIAPARTADILARIDTEKTFLVLVDGGRDPPICKLIDKSEWLRSEKAARKAATKGKKLGGLPKEIQLTWATTTNDLGHKLKPAVRAFADQLKVNVIVDTPPGRLGSTSRSKTPEEKKALVAQVDEAMKKLGGTKVGETYEGARVQKMTQKWEPSQH